MYLLLGHLLCFTLHLMYERGITMLTSTTLNSIFIYLKICIYLSMLVLSLNIYSQLRKQTLNNTKYIKQDLEFQFELVVNWILIEIIVFFYNFMSLVIFMFISRFKKFLTYRERVGLAYESGPFCRKEQDYLEYVSNDVKYFSNWFIFANLVLFGGINHSKELEPAMIDLSFGLCVSIHMAYGYFFGRHFFNSKLRMNINFIEIFCVFLIFLCNIMLIPLYLRKRLTVQVWSLVEVTQIVFNFAFLFDITYVVFSWPKKIRFWKKQLRLQILIENKYQSKKDPNQRNLIMQRNQILEERLKMFD